MNISKLKGIGDQTSQRFAKLGIYNTDDLLLFYPRGYEQYDEPVLVNDICCDGVVAIYARIMDAPKVNYRSRTQALTVTLSDERGNVFTGRWFHSSFMLNQLKRSYRYVFRGRVHFQGSRLVMDMPKLYSYEEYINILRSEPMKPIYRLTEGLHQNGVAKAVEQCFEGDLLPEEFLPKDMIERLDLLGLRRAIYGIHFPKNFEELNRARHRLVFDEFLLFSLSVRKNRNTNRFSNHFKADYSEYSGSVLHNLGFPLTNAQQKVYEEIHMDFMGDETANRLIQGDVGSGKTILAILAMLDMGYTGYQSVLMAPTEVLATQHFEKISALLKKNEIPLKAALLTGSVKEADKKKIREGLSNGDIDLLIGTHAVITDKVEYANLGLVITDEQHRFGVCQRESLYNKGLNPHVIVMSATPIPRSLAVILYGDLDISILDEKPANRLPIKNCVVDSSYHPNAYRFISKEVLKGHQAYVICAMAETSEDNEELENVVDYSEELKSNLEPGIRVAYLHGKMRPAEKTRIMDSFAAHEIDVLVSTTVIEVGIDVPNATVIMIENAERFGLAALHQIRGRVGRGDEQSYCIFVSDTKNEQTKSRLNILKDSNDGFYIAECDLKLRGPGDLLGTRQSGDLGFSIGDIYADVSELKLAAEEAGRILQKDTNLELPEHEELAKRLNEYMEHRMQRLSI